jgi:hypothetical protein
MADALTKSFVALFGAMFQRKGRAREGLLTVLAVSAH